MAPRTSSATTKKPIPDSSRAPTLANTKRNHSQAEETSLKTTMKPIIKDRIRIRPAPSNYVWRIQRTEEMRSSTSLSPPQATSAAPSQICPAAETIKTSRCPNRTPPPLIPSVALLTTTTTIKSRSSKAPATSSPSFIIKTNNADLIPAVATASSKPASKPNQRDAIKMRPALQHDMMHKTYLTPPQSPTPLFFPDPAVSNYNCSPNYATKSQKSPSNMPSPPATATTSTTTTTARNHSQVARDRRMVPAIRSTSPYNRPNEHARNAVPSSQLQRTSQSVVGRSVASLRQQSSHVADLVKQLKSKIEQKNLKRKLQIHT